MDTKKSLKNSVLIGQRHDELQREAWTDKVFVGDNIAFTAREAQSAAARNDALGKNTRDVEGADKEDKKEVPSTTLATAGVELVMVKDIRRALRRKYASRSNIDRIFQQWDKNQSGAITAEDLCSGLNKIGIRASLEEAMALKASVAHAGDMTPAEFSELVFSTDEKLAVDLHKIDAPSTDDKIKAFERYQLSKQPIRLDLESLNKGEHE